MKPQKLFFLSGFSVEQFEENLTTSLDAENPMGYAYVITQNGQVKASGSAGLARSVADGNKVMSINEIMHVASVSKTITTAAVLKLLDEKGISVNASIAPYLPSHWVQGAGIAGSQSRFYGQLQQYASRFVSRYHSHFVG